MQKCIIKKHVGGTQRYDAMQGFYTMQDKEQIV